MEVPVIIATLGLAAWMIYRAISEWWERRWRRREVDAVESRVRFSAEKHVAALVRRYRQSIYKDDYGKLVRDDWERHLDYFLERVVMDPLVLSYRHLAYAVIEVLVTEAIARERVPNRFDETMSAADFERFCADELSRVGWQARVIGASGDQGVDVVAEKNGRRIVLQCKKYSSPVGNKAVQEAFAGMHYHSANAAYVVSNGAYTKAALQLASTTGVRLMHYSELHDLENA
jgi:restriction system protein